jgi:hypothetical protein
MTATAVLAEWADGALTSVTDAAGDPARQETMWPRFGMLGPVDVGEVERHLLEAAVEPWPDLVRRVLGDEAADRYAGGVR